MFRSIIFVFADLDQNCLLIIHVSTTTLLSKLRDVHLICNLMIDGKASLNLLIKFYLRSHSDGREAHIL